MKSYYIRTETYGTEYPHIIDEKIMNQAEMRMNYLNHDEYMFHCKADSLSDAVEKYWKEFSEMCFDYEAEKY